jgi:hypothetical protein
MTRAIVREVGPERVILFGSYARGAAAPGSDVDMIVVERKAFRDSSERRRETSRIRSAIQPFRVAADILVYGADEVRKWQDSVNHVLARGMREGRLLYERS